MFDPETEVFHGGTTVPTMVDFITLVGIINHNVVGMGNSMEIFHQRITALEERLRVTQSYIQDLRKPQ